MIRLELLQDGVFNLLYEDGTRRYAQQLPDPIKERFMLLRTADVHTRIDRVGTRLGESLYWIDVDENST